MKCPECEQPMQCNDLRITPQSLDKLRWTCPCGETSCLADYVNPGGTIIDLKKKDAAIVLKETGMELHLPKDTGDGDNIVPAHCLVITAFAARLAKEKGFAKEMIDWLETFGEEMGLR